MSVNADSGRAQRDRRSPGHQARTALMQLLEPVVAGAGFDLEDVIVTPAGKRRQVRVIVDADGGVSLDDVAVVSREISAALDDGEAMGSGPYVLEVTSPGVDRPLTQPRHWRRASSRLVRATLAEGGEVTGRVIAADDQAVVLDTGDGERRLEYGELTRGLVQVEFNRRDGDDPDGDED
jgi:ribosome maturation factor RimP